MDTPRTALVIGGAGGIGAASARLLARDGFFVVVADVQSTEDTVSRVVAAGGEAAPARIDLADVPSFEGFLAGLSEYPPIGAVVVAAAVMGPRVELGSYPLEDFQRVIDVNLTGTMFFCQTVANLMAGTGGGRIVLFSSASGRSPVSTLTIPYSMSKAAIPILVHCLSLAYREAGILVSAIDPGRVITNINADNVGEGTESLVGPRGRLLDADEVAEVVAFMCSTRASGVTSAVWGVSTRP